MSRGKRVFLTVFCFGVALGMEFLVQDINFHTMISGSFSRYPLIRVLEVALIITCACVLVYCTEIGRKKPGNLVLRRKEKTRK